MGSGIVPNEFTINGDLIVRLDRESMILAGMVILIVIIMALIAYRAIKG